MLGLAMAPAWVDAQIAAWDFTGENTVATSTAEVFDANMDASNLVTRGVNAPASSGTNSFRTQGFQNDGISTANLDYFQITLSASTGYTLSLSTIDARLTGTSSYSAAPGASNQFAYSLDGTTFSLIGSPAVVIGTNQTIPQIDVTGIPALQNVADGVTITLRFYATGQTGTGGWGFYSNTSGAYGLAVGGTLTPSGPACGITLNAESAVCNSMTSGAGNDTYDLSIPYNGVQAGVTVINNSGSGSVTGDDPATVSDGTIVISGISEDDAYDVTFSMPCDALTVSGAAPNCEPAPAGTIINFDDDLNWTQGSVALTSYASDHLYASNDWSFTGGPALRQGTAAQDGFPGAFGTYSWRLQNVATVDWRATWQGTDIIDVFGFKVRRWDGSPSPAFEVSYSTDGGSTFSASVQTIDNTYLNNTSDWTTFSYTIPSPAAVAAGQFVVRVASTGTTERIMIDDFYFETSPLPPGAGIVINEVDSDTPGTDDMEFVELYGPANAPLDGLVLVFWNGSNDQSYSAIDLDGFSLDANGFFVAGNSGVTPAPGVTFANNLLQNGADAVALYVGDATDFPTGTPVTATNIIDALVYDTDDADDTGLLSVLTPGQPQINENANGNKDLESCSRFPDGGTPLNTSTYVVQLATPGATNVGSCGVVFQTESAVCNSSNPGPGDTYDLSIPYSGIQAGVTVINNSASGSVSGDDPATVANGTIVISGINETDNYDVSLSSPCDLVNVTGQAPVCEPPIDYTVLKINEVDYDMPGTDTTEFVEIKNTGALAINIGGVQLQLINGSNGLPYATYVLNNTVLAAGDYYVVGSSYVENVDQVEWTSNGIQNGAPDGVALLDPSNNLLDAVTYEGDIAGYTEGSGVGLEDNPTGVPPYNELSISRYPDGTDTDQNNVDFMVKCITPGTTNSPANDFCVCAPAQATIGTQCIDEFTFNIIVNVTDLGSSSNVVVLDDLNGYLEIATTTGPIVLGPYNNNDVVAVSLLHESNTLCDVTIPGITNDCAPPPPCFDNEMSLSIRTDEYPYEITWEITPAGGGAPLCSGGPYFVHNNMEVETCCLPDGCYALTFYDSFGDGIDAPGGYVLRDPNGERILDSDGTYSSAGTADQPFCLPISGQKLVFLDRDREDWLSGESMIAQEDPDVSAQWGVGDQTDDGYQFWFLDPDGGYSRRILRNHATSGGYGPANATRACKLKVNGWVTLPIPTDVLLNVRVRASVNGVYKEFGPATRFKMLSAPVACPTTKLIDDPGNANYSCGVTRTFGGSDKIYCYPVSGANKYRWRFENADENFVRIIATTVPGLVLNWVTLPLVPGSPYDVKVQASFDGGANYCAYGDSCEVFIMLPSVAQNDRIVSEDREHMATLFPNPNNGEQVYLTMTGLPEGEDTNVSVEMFDMYGNLVMSTDLKTNGGTLNTVIDLHGTLADGLYTVNMTTGGQIHVERLIINK
ncbi:MAG: lamin tail domain-containing protein [Flavobacteriales bacterium]|nr:lamin tail domain-containing protein [Flavobacteriales bacterium]